MPDETLSDHDSYEDLTACALTPEREEELVNTQKECVFMWTNKAGEAFGVIMAYLPKDGKIWLTAAERRARISAVRRFPRSSVCINSTGSSLGGGRTVTYKGNCIIHDSREVKDWFYPEFAAYLNPGEPDRASAFQSFLDSPARVVMEFVPDYTLSFDSELMWARSPEVRG